MLLTNFSRNKEGLVLAFGKNGLIRTKELVQSHQENLFVLKRDIKVLTEEIRRKNSVAQNCGLAAMLDSL